MPRKPDNSDPFIPRYSCTADISDTSGLRLDRYVAENLKLISRSQIKPRKLRALVNGREVKVSRLLKGGESLELSWQDAEPSVLVPEDIPLEIIYEDENAVVINKAQGMVVHPGAGNHSGTLANALYFRMLGRGYRDSSRQETFNLRPGIVHRLDKDTSGLIIAAYNDQAHSFLAGQFKQRKVIKTYAAVVRGCPPVQSGRIEQPIGRDRHNRKLFAVVPNGKPSLTLYRVARSWNNYSLLLLRLKTGRTHQIRVHLKYLGFPIIGDPLYGRRDPFFPGQTLMLHAKRLTLELPGKGIRTFRTIFPDRFKNMFSVLDNK